MKYIILTLFALSISITAGCGIVHLTAKKVKLPFGVRSVLSAFIATTILVVSSLGYFSVYYHADDSVNVYLTDSDTVKVRTIDNGYFFDGKRDDAAIIFYPGAKVEAKAYAPLMFELAEQGYDCFLFDMPFNMAIFGADRADDVIRDYDKVYMMGHSLGGSIASVYASKHPDEVDGLILLASYPTDGLNEGLRFLSIYGDRDRILEPGTYDKAHKYWPDDSVEYVLQGGNHSGYAEYGSQTGDGEAAVDGSTQRQMTVIAITEWIEG